jgi:hypothetical protein
MMQNYEPENTKTNILMDDKEEVEIVFKTDDSVITLKKILLCIMTDMEIIKQSIKQLNLDISDIELYLSKLNDTEDEEISKEK